MPENETKNVATEDACGCGIEPKHEVSPKRHADAHKHDQAEDCAMCEQGAEGMFESIETMIAGFGHAVIATRIDIPEGELSMSFTVGLSRQGLPELIVFALPDDVAQAMLNQSAELLKNGGLQVDVSIAQIAESFDIVFRKAAIEKVRKVTEALEAFACVDSPDVWQMVWPDKSGLYPWQAQFDESLVLYQPCLFTEI